ITRPPVGAIGPRADGTLDQTSNLDAVNGPAQASDLARRAHAAGRKAIVMVGGAGSQAAWRGATSNLPAFVDNLVGAMQALGFDGLDLDWEPIASADQPLLLALAKALRAKAPSAILTAPVYFVTGAA